MKASGLAVIPSARELLGFASNVDTSVIAQKVYDRLCDKVAGASFLTPVFLAEAQKTVDSVADMFRRAARWALAIKRASKRLWKSRHYHRSMAININPNIRGLPFDPSEWADLWMTWRYSVSTFLMDAEDLAEAAAEQYLGNRDTRYFNTHKDLQLPLLTFKPSGWTNLYISAPWYGEVEDHLFQYRSGATVRGWCRVKSDSNIPDFQRWGVDPLSVMWELIPFSFVADWGLDIGNYLSRISGFVGKVVEDAGLGTSRWAVGHGILRPKDHAATIIRLGFKVSLYNRESIGLTPTWHISPEPINLKRLLDAASLLLNTQRRV